MAIEETFTWPSANDPQGTVTFRRLVAQFGDGYRQAAADGINNKVQSWPLQFIGTDTYLAPILAFFDRHAGYRSFRWTPPLGEEGWYEVTSYSPTPIGGPVYTISATFQQVFKP
ncbi:Phage-related protein [Bordetella ansorpii]|uniref:Phage-related protein n=1 Tax=Bordetella ansorpii TaxID=288768 RepID=A0A157SJ42_9BORD|nr:phage tail protein [Bordetella ansorpii]SAI70472.1 Phage-related protein [Bordetella ansorpii]